MESAQELRESPTVRGDFPCHELTEWAASVGVIAGITNRGADFGLQSPESAGAVLERWRRFRAGLRPGFEGVVVAHQCHGATIATHRRRASGWRVEDEVDGHLTAEAGLLLGVTVADCVPVYLVEAGGRWTGLLHAGWRGVAGGIVERGVASLCELSGRAPADIVMHCGVSICGSCYEVGPEVYQAATGESLAEQRHLDLRAAALRRAERLGVKRITVSPWCTAHDNGAFYSHRASGGTDGRMVAYLGRPSP